MEYQNKNAEMFARHAHRGQMFNDELYGHHLKKVVTALEDFGYKGKWLDAGWLHATLYRSSITQAGLRGVFGEWVFHVVEALTPMGKTVEQRNTSVYSAISQFPDAAVIAVAVRIARLEARKQYSLLDTQSEFYCHVGCRVKMSMQDRLRKAYSQHPIKDGLR